MLSRLATFPDSFLGRAYIEYQEAPGINCIKEIQQVIQEPSWMDPYIRYISEGVLIDESKEARLLKKRVSCFVLLDGLLYRKSFSYLLLKCLRPFEVDYILWKIHEGIYGNHLGGRSLAYKVLRQGYYWLTMLEDAVELVQKCD